MARQTKSAGPGKEISAASSAGETATGHSRWPDPIVSDLVKSQVEDADLISQRRGQFVGTAIHLFSRKGYHSTTIREIAVAAGVSPGLIYQYVTDKEDILFLALQLIVHTNERVIPAAMAGVEHPVHKFIVAFEEYCRVFDENREAAILTYRETKSLTREHRQAIKQMELDTNGLIGDCIEACIQGGFFRPLNVELFIYQVTMSAHTWALKHWRLNELVPLEEYIKSSLDFMMNAVATPEGLHAYAEFIGKEGNRPRPPALLRDAGTQGAKIRRARGKSSSDTNVALETSE